MKCEVCKREIEGSVCYYHRQRVCSNCFRDLKGNIGGMPLRKFAKKIGFVI